jgi:UDP-N-acetylmuramoyl-tripeptide--D-alanyl-D-alanine ligase
MKSLFKTIIVFIITWEAKLILKKYKPQIVGVTGSVGKTSSKDAIYTVFKSTFKVRKSDKSFNSEIGIPLTILGCHNAWSDLALWVQNIFHGLSLILFKHTYPKWLVLEIGADRPGDIRKVSAWLNPDVAVITRFGKVPVHVEFFNSPEEVIAEKTHLALALKPEGTLVLNHDDEDVLALTAKVKNKVITYGMDSKADVLASNYNILYSSETGLPTGITFKVDYQGNSVPISIEAALGKAHIYPVLSAIAAGVSQGINLISICDALRDHKTPPGRMRLIKGMRNSIIIDDTYNSSPVAVNEALESLKALENTSSKIAVLGDMLEIGKYSVEEHKKVGKKAADIADLLICVGLRARYIAEGAREAGMSDAKIFLFDKSPEATAMVKKVVKENNAVLVKGSQGVRTEKVVEAIMAHPEDKEKLLVRQDAQWKHR